MNTIARMSGFRFFERHRRGVFELRFSWAEISGGLGFAAGLYNWSENNDWSLHVHLGWPNIYLKLPFIPRREPRDQMLDSWSFTFFASDVHLNWGHRCKIVHFPWQWTHYRGEQFMADGTWADRREIERGINHPEGWCRAADHPDAWRKVLPYGYTLRSGEIQERQATITVSRSEYRWRWFKWLPFPRQRYQGIDVQFSDEVGERTGSWKGGCIGCGYTMLPGETAEQCLRRMEAERKFT